MRVELAIPSCMNLRHTILKAAQFMGAFTLLGPLAGRGVRILCYHGFSLGDEHRFRPKLFMTAGTFEKRLQWLRQCDYEPVTLEVAVARIKNDGLNGRELVITIDDGFYSVKSIGWPLLKAYGFPATLYVTSYYTRHANPIFRLALQYMVWRTARETLDLRQLALPFPEDSRIISLRTADSSAKLSQLIDFAESQMNEADRATLAALMGEQLGVDYEKLRESRQLSLLTVSELTELHRSGLDLQLHTHRHRLGVNAEEIKREIEDNRRVLEPLTRRKLTHFCYPSGIWDRACWPALEAVGIESATTCEPGLNDSRTPLLGLRRILDAEDLVSVDLEAELSGFKPMLRRLLQPEKDGSTSGSSNPY